MVRSERVPDLGDRVLVVPVRLVREARVQLAQVPRVQRPAPVRITSPVVPAAGPSRAALCRALASRAPVRGVPVGLAEAVLAVAVVRAAVVPVDVAAAHVRSSVNLARSVGRHSKS